MKNIFILIALIGMVIGVSAQETYPLPMDSTVTESTDDSAATDSADAANAPKPYERVKLYVDTVTNLVTYSGVVEQEESSVDSIYIRAKKFLKANYGIGEKGYKPDLEYQKTVCRPSFEAYMKPTPYKKIPQGRIEFTLTIWYKDGRYKYQINNIIHFPPPNSLNKEPKPIYFEYYLSSSDGVKGTDLILKAADDEFNKFIAKMKKALGDPIQLDEDDW